MMFVFKLSWLPYMLICVGILFIIEEEIAGVIMVLVGVIWLLARRRSKKANANPSAKVKKPGPSDVAKNEAAQSTSQPQREKVMVCPSCGKIYPPDQVYCEECGSPLKEQFKS